MRCGCLIPRAPQPVAHPCHTSERKHVKATCGIRADKSGDLVVVGRPSGRTEPPVAPRGAASDLAALKQNGRNARLAQKPKKRHSGKAAADDGDVISRGKIVKARRFGRGYARLFIPGCRRQRGCTQCDLPLLTILSSDLIPEAAMSVRRT